MDIGNIVTGHINEFLGLNKDISKARLSICRKCPLYNIDITLGAVCNKKLWINPKTNEISKEEKEGYIRGCGCRLQAKTTIPKAKCIIDKW